MTFTFPVRFARRAATMAFAASIVALLGACPSNIDGRVDRIGGPISGGTGGGTTGGSTGGGTGGGTPTTEIRAAFTDLVVGGASSCGLTEEGKAYCWGHNRFADLGLGHRTNQSVPRPVSTSERFTFMARDQRACAITALGAAWCWGQSYKGLLNTGNTAVYILLPERMQTPQVWKTMVFGSRHMCGIDNADEAWCWGDNSAGALGIGMFGPDSLPTPQRVLGGMKWSHIAAGDDFTCGRTTAGTVYCWGDGFTGVLGSAGGATHTPRAVTTTTAFRDVQAGSSIACAMEADVARLSCWGRKEWTGSDGDDALTPRRVALDEDIVQYSVGNSLACAVTASKSAWCWGGFNRYGELGNGTTVPSQVPVRVQSAIGILKVSAGADHACAIGADGNSYCWGNNGFGELGNGLSGSLDPNPTPVRVK